MDDADGYNGAAMPQKEIQEHLKLKKIMDEYRELKALLGIVRKVDANQVGGHHSSQTEGGKPVRAKRMSL
ncbi:MAG TPA: hypothetical protein VFA33_02515 [Bryobacteraceae bacterium]|nr:hypothetical protein [Bryobacteraceae bacterium]